MIKPLSSPLLSHDGRRLKALVVTRANTVELAGSDVRSQAATCEAFVHQHHDGDVENTVFVSRSSTESTDQSLDDIERQIENGQYDVVVCTDLSRVSRNMRRIHDIWRVCVDHGTRLIAIDDGVDTAESDWDVAMFATTNESGK
jgi:DNA invertase Pin-like site-specific DNA recombinase